MVWSWQCASRFSAAPAVNLLFANKQELVIATGLLTGLLTAVLCRQHSVHMAFELCDNCVCVCVCVATHTIVYLYIEVINSAHVSVHMKNRMTPQTDINVSSSTNSAFACSLCNTDAVMNQRK